MGPKKNKKRNDDEDDELFNKKEKEVQEILKKVSKSNPSKQNAFSDLNFDDQDEIDSFKKKSTFDWQLSQQNVKALQKIQEKKEKQFKQKQQQQLQAKKLTPKQQQQLERTLQKQKLEKLKKQQKRQEKKAQRLKQLEEQKLQQQKLKEQQEKQNQQVEKKLKKPSTGGKCIPIFFIVFILTLCVLQYQRQIYVRLSKFKLESEQNFYDIFEIDSGVTDRQLKEKYKRLVLKYHPDKNPNCKDCESKFNQIIKAWQVLGSPQKRRHYDANSGFVTQIKSQSITLTPSNYEDLVEGSRSLWIIQVYDSTEKYCHYFAQFWEEFVQQYGGFIKFGRVDVWTQGDMLSYLPYKFQVFPSIYYYHKGEVELCDFDFQNPDMSLRRCIESQYKENIVTQINSLNEAEDNQKVSIVFTQKFRMGSRFKIINKKYQSDFNFYCLLGPNSNHQILAILPNKDKQIFSLSVKQQDYYEKYENFLESLIVQKINTCELISTCENQACFILLGLTQESIDARNYTVPKQDPHKSRPVFVVDDVEFQEALDELKNKTEMIERFDLGVYQNGHIDLGYLNEADILNPEEGENFQKLDCVYKDRSWLGRIKQAVEYVKRLVTK